jgi:hypothetical protein
MDAKDRSFWQQKLSIDRYEKKGRGGRSSPTTTAAAAAATTTATTTKQETI